MSKPPDEEQRRLAEATEKQLELPPGLLVRYLDNGGQIDAKARATVLDAYGIDPKLSKRNAVDAAGLALQDALQRNNNDPAIAIAELHGGQDRSKWNKGVNDFAARVSMPPPVVRPAGRRSASGVQLQQQNGKRSGSGLAAPPPVQTAPVVGETPANPAEADAQQSMMPPEEIAAVEARNAPPAAAPVQAAPMVDAGPPPAGEAEGPIVAGPKTMQSYRDGTMDADYRAEFEDGVRKGLVVLPAGEKLQEQTTLERIASAPGRALGAVKEAVTGEKRRTAETEAAPDWSQIPEWNDLGTLKNVAALAASPREALQILQSNFPGMKVREDEKGNLFAFSPKAGREFAVKPGLDFGDVVRAGAMLPVYAATAATGGLPAIAAKEAAVQTGVELAQSGSGGEFNPTDIALAAATPVALAAGGAVKNAAGSLLRKGANAALDAVPGSTTRAVADAAAQGVDDTARAAPVAQAVDQTATQAIPGIAPAARQAEQTATQAAAAPLTEEATKELGPDIAKLIRAASGKGTAADAAKAELAKAFEVSPAALAAAERLGVEVPVDVLANNVQLKNIVGSLRAKVGTKAEADFAKAMGETVDKIDNVLADLGSESSPAGFSDRVLERFKEVQSDLVAKAKDAYAPINAAVKASDNVTLDNLAAIVAQRRKDMGGVLKGVDAQMAAIVERAKVMPGMKTRDGVARATFGVIKDEKAQIRKALERMESAYGSADENVLKAYQGALVADELQNVARIGGEPLAERARLANRLWAQKKELDEKITGAFGKSESGDISRLLLSAITDASKGSVAKLNKVLDVIPPEMHGEAIMTALGSLTRAKGGAAANAASFGAAEFTSLFRGLRAKGNEKIYARLEKAIGPKRAAVLRDVYEISRRVTDARAAIKGTGKDTQEALANIAAENLMGGLLANPVAKQAARGAGAVAGAAIGGLPGAGIGGAVVDNVIARIATGGEQQVLKAGELMMSPEFKALAVATVGGVNAPAVKEAARKVVMTKPFRDWWKATMSVPYEPKAAERWILAAMQAGKNERQK